MEQRWLIVADDLTGAADSAIAFAQRRVPARVTWGAPQAAETADTLVLAFDADTRQLDAAAGARRHREILQRLLGPRMHVFKKIDSTLRGHPAEEIGAMLDFLNARTPGLRAVFAPAFPAGGRVTRDARVFVHGQPLEHTEFWNAARPVEHADLVTLFETAGLHARHVGLDIVRGGVTRLRDTLSASICVCDAETNEDLAGIAAAALDGTPTFFAGSAGLAHALASHASRATDARRAPLDIGPDHRGALFVVGSQAGPSRAALAQLESLPALRRISVAAAQLLDDARARQLLPMDELARALEAGVDVAVDIVPPPAQFPAVSRDVVDALARRIAPLAAHASALMATGGDTAAALLARCDVHAIQLVDELEPGASLGFTLGERSLPVITKSGGFGDAGTLRRIAERLRFIRTTGTVA